MLTKYSIVVAAILGLGAAGLTYAADDAMGTTGNTGTTTRTENTNTTVTTQQDATQVQQPAEMKWTELKGRVEHIDLTQKTVQIKEKGTDKLIEVPVDNTVKVMDNSNHAIALGDLKQGQKVIIRHNDAPQS